MTNTTQKIALITGGSRGLGRNAALHLAQGGVDIILTYRSRSNEADAVVAEIEAMGRKVVALQLDTGAAATFNDFAEAVQKVLDETWNTDRFDFLLNNAGHGVYADLLETSEEQFDGLYNVHVKGPLFLMQALSGMIRDGGRILNVSSGLARFSIPGYGAYAAAKGAVEVMSRYLAKELGSRKIAVNVIAPGAIETDFGGGAVRDNEEVNAFIASTTAMGRAGQPDDIGEAVAGIFLRLSQWTTAQRIEVSGGQSL